MRSLWILWPLALMVGVALLLAGFLDLIGG